jgi:hypothetical protein
MLAAPRPPAACEQAGPSGPAVSSQRTKDKGGLFLASSVPARSLNQTRVNWSVTLARRAVHSHPLTTHDLSSGDAVTEAVNLLRDPRIARGPGHANTRAHNEELNASRNWLVRSYRARRPRKASHGRDRIPAVRKKRQTPGPYQNLKAT